MERRADVAIIGAGIVGLAHAWAAARRGKRVVLFERDGIAQGASVRNFGMVWPIGQPPGELLQRAQLSRQYWLELREQQVVWVEPCGSLHLAYHSDEQGVLEEFVAQHREAYGCALLTPAQALERSPAMNPDGLRAGLWSPGELCVDPRQAVARLPLWLREQHEVEVRFATAVTAIDMPHLRTASGDVWRVEQALVCSGSDFQTLFPEVFVGSGIRRCKLQMMRTAPQPGNWRLGPHLAGGLTLCHYAAFAGCPTLPALKRRFDQELPRFLALGIHVMCSQNHLGEVVIGDSHEYDGDISPFDKVEIDALILAYLDGLVRLPDPSIASRWHGIYAKHPTLPLFTAEPQPGAHVLVAPGGAGMTLSFGQAEEWWRRWDGVSSS